MMERRQTQWQGHSVSWFEAGTGPVILLLHGGGGTGKAFAHQMASFSQDFRVLALDMPGFGQSDLIPAVETIQDIAHVVREWLALLKIRELIIGGNSMGGRVALQVAALIPSQIQALIVLDSVGVPLSGTPIINPLTLAPREFISGLVYDTERFRKLTPYRTLDDIKELTDGRKVFARYTRHEPISPLPLSDLKKLAMPALLIWGRQDKIIPLAYGKALQKALPDAELVVFEDCGHMPHIEWPHLCNQAIKHFIARRVPNLPH